MAFKGRVKEVAVAETTRNDWLTVDEVAELCGMTHGRVCQLLRSGEMDGEKVRGVFWQVKRQEAERFVTPSDGKGRPRKSQTEKNS